MNLHHVTHRFQFGAALSESGLNTVSAGLRDLKPELFDHSTDVTIHPVQPPPHTLTVYAIANKPIAFNLYPVVGTPTVPVPEDSLLMEADLSFSLRDSQFAGITSIGIVFQITANIVLTQPLDPVGRPILKISMIDFNVLELRGEHPTVALAALSHAVDHGVPVVGPGPAAGSDTGLADTFEAIVNYLIKVFLKNALTVLATEFPVPPVNELIKFNQLGHLPVQGINIRNNALYVFVGDPEVPTADFPLPILADPNLPHLPPPQLCVGISESGLARVVRSFLPMPIPVDVATDNSVFHITGTLQITEITLDVHPGADRVYTRVFIGGDLNIHCFIHIPKVNVDLDFDMLFPLDDLTGYVGSVIPRVRIDLPSSDNPTVHVTLEAVADFLDAWYVLVVTNYRTYVKAKCEAAARRLHESFVVKILEKIPIIGWVVKKTIDYTEDVVAFLVGNALDLSISASLSLVMNTLGRLFVKKFLRQFEVASLEQCELRDRIGVTIRDAAIISLDNGRGGELEARLWFAAMGLPVPEPPSPVQTLPIPEAPPIEPIPGVTLPEYGQGHFLPPVSLPSTHWPDGAKQSYGATACNAGDNTPLGPSQRVELTFERNATRWTVTRKTTELDGTVRSTLRGQYADGSFVPLQSEYVSNEVGVVLATQALNYETEAGKAVASHASGHDTSRQYKVSLFNGIPLDFEDLWIFRVAHMDLDASISGVFGRVELSDPYDVKNWARLIPVKLSVAPDRLTVSTPPPPGSTGSPIHEQVAVWRVTATEEDCVITAWVGKDGSGTLKVTTQSSSYIVTLVREDLGFDVE